MKKVYVQEHEEVGGAGKWIYQGYKNAWKLFGYETQYFHGEPEEWTIIAEELKNQSSDIRIMITDGFYHTLNLKEYSFEIVNTILEKATIYMFAQPTNYPLPWGSHPNFKSMCSIDEIQKANSLDNIKLWSFGEVQKVKKEYFSLWKDIASIPLAFDNIAYEYLEDDKYKFDVCFIGGRANNGFDEKYKIMMSHFSAFKDSGLKCGIFVGKNLTHEQENKLLYNSKVAINIHDAYQRELGLDTNERTFKSLGLTGVLVSDKIGQVNNLFPDVKTTNDAKEMVKFVKEYVNMPEKELQKIKTENRKLILEKHTYTNRVKELLDL